MKLGVSVSSAAHVAILAWGLISLSGPEPLDVADVEAFTVDIVPIEEITKSIQGEKSEELTAKPAPTPTKKPEETPEAENVGETDNDTKAPREVEPKPVPVEKAATSPEPPAPSPTEDTGQKPEEQPAPATELAALSDPAVPATEEPAAEIPEIAEAGEQFAKLPDSVPVPAIRPKPPKPTTAKTPERKKPKKEPAKAASNSAQQAETSTQDKISALLNKQEPASGGAKSSTEQASLGTELTNGADKLSQSEMDALRAAIERCSTGFGGGEISEDLKITITIELGPDGFIIGDPLAEARGGTSEERTRFARAMLRSVLRCAPYDLPAAKYNAWSRVIPTFYPAQMFN